MVVAQQQKMVLRSCPRCGAPLTAHRFGLWARCDHCLLNVIIDSDGVDAAVLQQARAAYCDTIAAWPHGIVAEGRHARWIATAAGSQNATWRVQAVESLQWPSSLGLLVQPIAEPTVGRLLASRTNLQQITDQALAARLTLHPALPALADLEACNGAPFVVLRTGFEHRHLFGAIQQAYGHLPLPVSVWVLVRLLGFAAWLHQMAWTLGAMSVDDVVFAADEHQLTVINFAHSSEHATLAEQRRDLVAIVDLVDQMVASEPSVAAKLAPILQQLRSDAPDAATAMRQAKQLGELHVGRQYAPLQRLAKRV